jgi:glyoxylate/hydroxypyruvate reductase A
VRVLHGAQGLEAGLDDAEVVLNLLPLTPHTRGLIDAAFLGRMKAGVALVNFGRGGHVVEADLLAALAAGRLAHAVLDVFASEPLPPDHPFWQHPRVTVLPHVAALTDLRSAAEVVASNLARLQAGQPLLHLVDRMRGY